MFATETNVRRLLSFRLLLVRYGIRHTSQAGAMSLLASDTQNKAGRLLQMLLSAGTRYTFLSVGLPLRVVTTRVVV